MILYLEFGLVGCIECLFDIIVLYLYIEIVCYLVLKKILGFFKYFE